MTPKTLTPAELDVLDAMLPDCNPPECTDAAMYDLDEEETRTARALFAIVNAAPALLSMARRLGDVTCQKCKRAFPHNEEMVCMCCNASLVSDACFYENRYVRVGDLTKQLTAATARADTAAARALAAEKRCGDLVIALDRVMLYLELHAQAHPEWNGNRFDDEQLANAALAAAKVGG